MGLTEEDINNWGTKKMGPSLTPFECCFAVSVYFLFGNLNIFSNGIAFSSIIRNREDNLVISDFYVPVIGILLKAGIPVAKLPKP